MDSRFTLAETGELRLAAKLIKKYFPELNNLRYDILYDLKKRAQVGKYVLGRVKKTDDALRLFTELRDDGRHKDCHVIFFFDFAVFSSINTQDKKRLIYHELCHVKRKEDDPESFYLIPHDFEGFYSEIEYNDDDPNWGERFAAIAAHAYATQEEE